MTRHNSKTFFETSPKRKSQTLAAENFVNKNKIWLMWHYHHLQKRVKTLKEEMCEVYKNELDCFQTSKFKLKYKVFSK